MPEFTPLYIMEDNRIVWLACDIIWSETVGAFIAA